MATILLSAAGAAVGGGFGGTLLGLSGAVIGRAVGATVGRVIDRRLLGGGSRAVETGRIDRLRLQSAGEGRPIAQVWGQIRVPGHVIWAAPLVEVQESHGGGKGSGPSVKEYSYRGSFALALCTGAILGVGRIWADGEEISAQELNMKVYNGSEDQLPDPCIAAHEGDDAPAYRGIAYVVIEDLGLGRWQNRVPQLSFEVIRPARGGRGPWKDVTAVAMIPGTGKYSLATEQVGFDLDLGETAVCNVSTPQGATDFMVSLGQMCRELPSVESVSLVVSWFGDDLRAGSCKLKPKVEDKSREGDNMVWRSGGIDRSGAEEVSKVNGRPIYGGTPADRSVIQALRSINAAGRKAVFYPFILMEQLSGNGKTDPWSGAAHQPVMPWRGRITTAVAAGRQGTTDCTATVDLEVAAFFGSAAAGDFSVDGDTISYNGPDEWSFRRFILHYAQLCAAAGGVDSFLIGSEMIGLTQMRGAGRGYPAVQALRALAADVRAILGPDVKLSYAADWSEYFGHHPGGGELRFHLDPLWADKNIDFIGIDNYMPLSDWRDGYDHLDSAWERIDNIAYLKSNVTGGEGYDWFYASDLDRENQSRTPITDGVYNEPWVWRCKDLANWWGQAHHERSQSGVRSASATAWKPRSKPIWFTELGCAALDKATNQPNKFLDAMSSESVLPYFSNGRRDDVIQAAYLRAMASYWGDAANNPTSTIYGGSMVDVSRMHVWCWDARPFPVFPQRTDLWSDGPAWERGHWLNGRASAVPLEDLVAQICRETGVRSFDTSNLSGIVRGYRLEGDETGRAALQPLMLAYGFDAVEDAGVLRFVMRDRPVAAVLTPDDLAIADDLENVEITRAPQAELSGKVRVSHIEAGSDYEIRTAEAATAADYNTAVSDSEFSLCLTRPEGHAVAERWLVEAEAAQDRLRLALPPSWRELGPGDVIEIAGAAKPAQWRIDRVERAGAITIEASRIVRSVYTPSDGSLQEGGRPRAYAAPVPTMPIFLDLPLMRGNELPYMPHLAVTSTPWAGSVAVLSSAEEEGGYALTQTITRRAIVGRTITPLPSNRAGCWDMGPALRVKFKGGQLRPASDAAVLGGANVMAIGNGSPNGWELFQFSQAKLVGQNEWEIRRRLRGQAGTDAIMPAIWPAGSLVVLIDGAPKQIDLPPSLRGQVRYWRIGPALRSPDDPSYRSVATTLFGIGLRPLSPCHLGMLRLSNTVKFTWIRRTRINGDGWDGADVPLGEARERYRARLLAGSTLIRDAELPSAEWTLSASDWAQVSSGPVTLEVAQLSDEFGPGPFARRIFND
ncbi:baseplate multidomain protein megatron [Paracoccus pacificus]|uniref:Glycoside hydrolase/phage tail family protein n=1 Tax=Paracoccus pacificus TaxID=1463598 RepID=A0ABW4R8W4_9RHOB